MLTLSAAVCSASYYVLVLVISPGTRPSAILAYPFLTGGGAYLLAAIATGRGREFAERWRQPSAYALTCLLVVTQLSILAATYLTGPVDASLLTLVGDVIATPVLAAAALGAHRKEVRSPWFVGGLTLCFVGGAIAIVGGHSLAAVPPLGWVVVPAVPISVAAFVLLAARTNESAGPTAVVGQSTLASGLAMVALAPVIPGGWSGLAPVGGGPWIILVALGLTSFFAAPLLYFAAIGRAGFLLPPMLMTAIPVLTLLLSAAVLHIGLSLVAALGIPLAILGGLLAIRGVSAPDRPLEFEPAPMGPS
jgi:drug/metabolite transporter (DMT)-like permease